MTTAWASEVSGYKIGEIERSCNNKFACWSRRISVFRLFQELELDLENWCPTSDTALFSEFLDFLEPIAQGIENVAPDTPGWVRLG